MKNLSWQPATTYPNSSRRKHQSEFIDDDTLIIVKTADPKILRSTDGYTWNSTSFTATANPAFYDIAYSPSQNRLVAVAGSLNDGGSSVYHSDNKGQTWTRATTTPILASCVAYSPTLNLFVALSGNDDSNGMYSSDGDTWTAFVTPQVQRYTTVSWNPFAEEFLATGYTNPLTEGPVFAFSTDGINWDSSNPSPGSVTQWHQSMGIEGKWVAVGTDGVTNVVENEFASKLTQLTFADPNPDLKYFKKGDVVQGIDVTETYDFKGSDDFVAYDSAGAVLETVNFGGTVTNTTVVNNLYYDVKVPRANLVFVRYAGFTDGNTFVLFGSNDPSSAGWTELVRQDSISDDDTFTNGSSPYRYFVLNCTGQMNPSKYGIATEIAEDAVKVISTDLDANTMVVDSGTWNNGDVVEYQTNGGQGDIVSVNTTDNTILLTETGDRDNRWIAENKAGTDFYVAGPSVVDEPLLTANVELESSLFATTPDNADTLKNIVWELNGAEQNAGTSNPYKPSGLALNTEYTVRVKHQGNALEDSAWSTSTTFTTGATRNLYTYYKERVDTLVARVEALENPGY